MSENAELVGVVARQARKVRRAEVMSELQSRLISDIEKNLKGVSPAVLKAAGIPTQQGRNKWAHGSSPRLSSLEAVAEFRRTEVLLAIPGVSDPAGSLEEYFGGHAMNAHDRELARLIDAMDEGERRELLGYLKGTLGRRRPQDPDAE